MLYDNFTPGTVAPKGSEQAAIWFAFQSDRLVMFDDGQGVSVPQADRFETLNIPFSESYYIGLFHQTPVYAVAVPTESVLPPPYFQKDLRALMIEVDETLFSIAGRAKQVVQWSTDHAFCSRCGAATKNHSTDRAKECIKCEFTQYPRLSPCVIGLVTRGPEILLARSPHFPPNMFSTLAGFVEPGETLEEAFSREVGEEVGVSVAEVKYCSSQPWPFPHSLMIGFEAEYAEGDIKVDGVEIEEADWFHVDQLPLIPPLGSISRQLIDQYVEQWRR